MEPRRVVYNTALVLATVLVAYFLYRLIEVLVLVFAAVILASAVRPFVDGLSERGVRRGVAILLVYALILVGFILLLIVSVPPMISLIVDLVDPEGLFYSQIAGLGYRLFTFGWQQFQVPLPTLRLPEWFQQVVGEASQTAESQAVPIARNTILGLSQVLLAFVMGFYWLMARDSILDLMLQLSPPSARHRVKAIWLDIEKTVGGYVRAQGLMMLLIGAVTFVGLLLLRVPRAVALAVVAGLTEAIPMVGPVLGAIPAVVLGFTVSPTIGLAVIGLYIVVQQVEGNVLVPKVMEREVGLHPLVVIFALVAGGILGGVVGALLAVPVAGALQVAAKHLWLRPTIDNHRPITADMAAQDKVPQAQADAAVVEPANDGGNLLDSVPQSAADEA